MREGEVLADTTWETPLLRSPLCGKRTVEGFIIGTFVVADINPIFFWSKDTLWPPVCILRSPEEPRIRLGTRCNGRKASASDRTQNDRFQSHRASRPPVTVNPLPLRTFPTPITDPDQPHRVIHTDTGTGRGLKDQGAILSTVNSVQHVSGCQVRQRKTSELRGTIAGLLLRQRGAWSRPRGASFGCMALLSTCTKATGAWDLI